MSNIAVLGTGTVGDTIGSKLISLGHQVMMGSRTSGNEKAKAFTAKHPGKAMPGHLPKLQHSEKSFLIAPPVWAP